MMMAEENKEESSFRYYQIHMTLKMTMLKNQTTLISKHDTMKLKTVQLQSPLSTWVSLKKKKWLCWVGQRTVDQKVWIQNLILLQIDHGVWDTQIPSKASISSCVKWRLWASVLNMSFYFVFLILSHFEALLTLEKTTLTGSANS